MKQKLVQTAMDMRNHAHAPYSNYRVGAAVETESGEIIGGCNVESSSYGLTCCAERIALFRAIAEGHTSLALKRRCASCCCSEPSEPSLMKKLLEPESTSASP